MLRFSLVAALGLLVACPSPKPTVTVGSTTVKGTLRLSKSYKGKKYKVFLAKDKAGKDIVSSTSGTAGISTVIPYTIEKVPAGKFFLFALIDVNGDDDSDFSVDQGDLYGFFNGGEDAPDEANATVAESGEVDFDVELGKLNPDTYPDLGGTVTLPKDASGAGYAVFIDDDTDWDNGFVDFDTGVVSGSSVDYSMKNIDPGSDYFLYIWVDVDGDEEDSIGDLIGYYHGSGVVPPASAADSNLDLAGGAGREEAQDADFNASEVKNEVNGKIDWEDDVEEKALTIYFDADRDPTNGAVKTVKATVSGKEYSYKESGFAAGKIWVYATVDKDDSGDINTGDLLCSSESSCSGSGYIGVGRADLPAEGTTKLSFSLSQVKSRATFSVTAPEEALNKPLTIATQVKPAFAETLSEIFVGTLTKSPFTTYPSFSLSNTVYVAYAGDTSAMPHTGDFIGYFTKTDATPTSINIPNGEQTIETTLVPITNVVKGKFTLPSELADPKNCKFFLDDDNVVSNGATKTYAVYCSAVNKKYSFINAAAGDYVVHAWVDINENDEVDAGDLRGETNVTVTGSGDVTTDFTVTAVQ